MQVGGTGHSHAVAALHCWRTLVKGSSILALSAASDAFCTLGATKKVPSARPASSASSTAERDVPLALVIRARLVRCQQLFVGLLLAN